MKLQPLVSVTIATEIKLNSNPINPQSLVEKRRGSFSQCPTHGRAYALIKPELLANNTRNC